MERRFILSYFGDYYNHEKHERDYVDTTLFFETVDKLNEQAEYLMDLFDHITFYKSFEVIEYKHIDIKK